MHGVARDFLGVGVLGGRVLGSATGRGSGKGLGVLRGILKMILDPWEDSSDSVGGASMGGGAQETTGWIMG
jgi:hypothetical protein